MKYFEQATIAIMISIIILVTVTLLTGCANPRNNNNIHINLAQREQTRSLHRELARHCSPRSKCPHLWDMMENHISNMEQGIINAT